MLAIKYCAICQQNEFHNITDQVRDKKVPNAEKWKTIPTFVSNIHFTCESGFTIIKCGCKES